MYNHPKIVKPSKDSLILKSHLLNSCEKEIVFVDCNIFDEDVTLDGTETEKVEEEELVISKTVKVKTLFRN